MSDLDAEAICQRYDDVPVVILGESVTVLRDHCVGGPAHAMLPLGRRASPFLGGILAWGERYLRDYFSKPASAMHSWLGGQLDALQVNRGTKLNLIGPRGSAKSTIATLCYVL